MALFCGGRFLLNALFQMQSDLLIAALLIGGCLALRRDKDFLAAGLIGLSASIKCTPVLFVPYLAWRGKWLAALFMVCVAVGVNFLPDLVHRPPSGGSWAVDWYNSYVRFMAHEDFVPGTWFAEINGNQSLSGAINRLFMTSLDRTSEGVKTVSRKTSLSPAALRAITLLIYAIVAIPAALALWLNRRRRDGDRTGRAPPYSDGLEFSVIFLLMLLLSPRSSRTHFGIMLLPALCVGRLALSEHSRAAWSFLSLATLGSLISFSHPLNVLFPYVIWAGAVTLVAVLLLAGCIIGLIRERPSEKMPADTG
jgi:hypothetical protein